MDVQQSGDRGKGRPPPFIVEPSSRVHTHSIILLHGRGSNGEKFGKELLETGICSNGMTLPDVFPGARFIFPTSKRRRAKAFNRAMLTQWFDLASLDDPSHRSQTELEGIEESCREIIDMVGREALQVSHKNVILGGLSQGCATGLIALLALDFPLGGFVGMSGWLPFTGDIELLASGKDPGGDDDNDDDPFASEGGTQDPALEALDFVRDLVFAHNPEGASRKGSALPTPVFLGHGEADEKVRLSLGDNACRVLKSLGFHVEWKSYKDQGHWYKIPDEVNDVVAFIGITVGWA